MFVDHYYISARGEFTTLKPTALAFLKNNDLVAFIQACGPTYIRSTRKQAEFAGIFLFFSQETDPELLDAMVSRFTTFSNAGPNSGNTVLLQNLPGMRSMIVKTRASGLAVPISGNYDVSRLYPHSIEAFEDALELAYSLMLLENSGIYKSIEVVPWTSNHLLHSALNLNSRITQIFCYNVNRTQVPCDSPDTVTITDIDVPPVVKIFNFMANAEHVANMQYILNVKTASYNVKVKCASALDAIPFAQRILYLAKNGIAQRSRTDYLMAQELRDELIGEDGMGELHQIRALLNYRELYYMPCIHALGRSSGGVANNIFASQHWMDLPECNHHSCLYPTSEATMTSGELECEFQTDQNRLEYRVENYCPPQLVESLHIRCHGDSLSVGEALYPDEYICSQDGKFEYGLSSEGQVVIRDVLDNIVTPLSDSRYGNNVYIELTSNGTLELFNDLDRPPTQIRHKKYINRRPRPGHTSLWQVGEQCPYEHCQESRLKIQNLDITTVEIFQTENESTPYRIIPMSDNFSVWYNGYAYVLNSRGYTYATHTKIAQLYNGHLTWIENEKEWNFLKNYIFHFDDNVYIGLSFDEISLTWAGDNTTDRFYHYCSNDPPSTDTGDTGYAIQMTVNQGCYETSDFNVERPAIYKIEMPTQPSQSSCIHLNLDRRLMEPNENSWCRPASWYMGYGQFGDGPYTRERCEETCRAAEGVTACDHFNIYCRWYKDPMGNLLANSGSTCWMKKEYEYDNAGEPVCFPESSGVCTPSPTGNTCYFNGNHGTGFVKTKSEAASFCTGRMSINGRIGRLATRNEVCPRRQSREFISISQGHRGQDTPLSFIPPSWYPIQTEFDTEYLVYDPSAPYSDYCATHRELHSGELFDSDHFAHNMDPFRKHIICGQDCPLDNKCLFGPDDGVMWSRTWSDHENFCEIHGGELATEEDWCTNDVPYEQPSHTWSNNNELRDGNYFNLAPLRTQGQYIVVDDKYSTRICRRYDTLRRYPHEFATTTLKGSSDSWHILCIGV
uniref:C-type lectin domain-containing protein n=1 Tax=Corethron hystrix TaxID=216773 RepID=A0A7S1B7G8_9STRA